MPRFLIDLPGAEFIPSGDIALGPSGQDAMPVKTDRAGQYDASERVGSMGWYALVGLAAGSIPLVVCGSILLQPGAISRSLPLATCAIINPLLGAGLGCLYHRYRAPRRSLASSFFADAPLNVQGNSKGGRQIGALAITGFGVGIAIALLATILEVAWRGWSYLDATLIPAMIIYPWFCAAEGRHLGLRLEHPRPPIRRLRVSVRTLMVLVAYVGLMLGLGMWAVRLSRNARHFHEMSLSEQSIGDGFEIQAQKYLADVGLRTKNADELRHGRIPEELEDEHKTFLRSLDKTAGEEDRSHRFSQIAVLEEQRAQQSEAMFRSNDRSARHLKTLAAKHRMAAREPWVPVAPDPPFSP
jgi:hypothetical protein